MQSRALNIRPALNESRWQRSQSKLKVEMEVT